MQGYNSDVKIIYNDFNTDFVLVVRKYPHTAFALMIVGGVVELLVVFPYSVFCMMQSSSGVYFLFPWCFLPLFTLWLLIWGIVILISALIVKRGGNKVRTGAVIGLIASLFAPVNIISLIGSIIALGWDK